MPDRVAILRVVAIALVCGAALAGTNWLTEDRISYHETAALRAAVSNLLPAGAARSTRAPEIDRVPGTWRLCTGHLLGRSDTPGYAGNIRLLYTLDREAGQNRLVRLTVLGHQETPGIADFLADPNWLATLSDSSADDIAGISAVSGATITSRAVQEHLTAVLRDPAGRLDQPIAVDCTP